MFNNSILGDDMKVQIDLLSVLEDGNFYGIQLDADVLDCVV
jgi:hypothetical protein